MAAETIPEYFLIVWKRRTMVLLCTAIAVITAYAMSLRQPPLYESMSEFYVAEAVTPVGHYSGATPLIAVLRSAVLPALHLEVEYALRGLLESQAIRERVSEAVPGTTPGQLAGTAEVYSTRTHLLQVKIHHGDPQTAAALANAYPPALESFLADVAAPRERGSLEGLQGALDRAKAELEAARQELRAFLEEAQTADLQSSIAESLARRNLLEKEIAEAEVNLQSVENRLLTAEDRMRRENRLFVSGSEATGSSAARAIMSEIRRIEEQLAGESVTPERRTALREQLEQRKASLGREIEGLVTRTQRRFERRPDSLEEQLRRQIVTAYVDRAAIQAQISAKSLALEQLDKDAQSLPSSRLQEEFLRNEIERLQRMVDLATVSYEEGRAQLNGRLSQLVVVQEAVPATEPSFPLPGLGLAIAAMLGLAGGVYLAFASEYLSQLSATRSTA